MIKKSIYAMIVLLACSGIASAATYIRDPLTGNWSVIGEWKDNGSGSWVASTALPGASDTVIINQSRSVSLDTDATVDYFYLVNNDNPGSIHVDANNSLTVNTEIDLSTGPTHSGLSTFNQSAGTVSTPLMTMGGTAGSGTYNLTGGTLQMDGTTTINSGSTLNISGGTMSSTYSGETRNFSGAGSISMTSGSLDLNGGVNDGILFDTALFEVSGGTVDLYGQIKFGLSSAAEFKVVGDDASISIRALNQGAGDGTFTFEFDSTGVSAINSSGWMTLNYAKLVVDGSAYTGDAGTFTLFDTGNLAALLDTNNITISGFDSYGDAYITQDQDSDIITLTLISGNPYDDWAATHGLTAGVNDAYGDDAEPGGGDGMDNLLEYALGSDPLGDDAATFLPIHNQDGGYLNLVYRRRLDAESLGLDYNVYSTLDLVNNPMTNATEEAGSLGIDAEFESVTNRVLIDAESMQFMGLKVEASQ